ncbi:DUF4097 family beta strand repeat-containing protein [Sporolactobacillus pectinivorans]|uniref:DUF4097 family beta strand repeat-containing protein n=1 Tax=Sporolactobacillus pectinivorans TaxID=1591408 RepID=UPI000C268AF5|nr:DUF4097 family beta strand repeat-containing protein [Sporolactobacillus pectinivorans]
MKIYQKKALNADGLHAVVVTVSPLDVELVQTEDQLLKAEIQGEWTDDPVEKIELDVHAEGDAAIIRAKMDEHRLLFGIMGITWNRWVKVVVHVPARIYERVEIGGQSGDISVRRIIAETLSLSSKSGDIIVEDCEAKKELIAASTSGDIRITGLLAKEKVSARASSGDVVLRNLASDFLDAAARSGDVTVSDFRGTLAAEVSSGDIELENDQLTGDLRAYAQSGDVSISFRKDPESFAINYQGSSGEGSVHIEGILYKEKNEHRMLGQKGDGQYMIDVHTGSGDFVLN